MLGIRNCGTFTLFNICEIAAFHEVELVHVLNLACVAPGVELRPDGSWRKQQRREHNTARQEAFGDCGISGKKC
jgi:hypothetical protein